MKRNLPAAEQFELLFPYGKVSLYQPSGGFLFVSILKIRLWTFLEGACLSQEFINLGLLNFVWWCVIFVVQQYEFFFFIFLAPTILK